jgi:hypothetical protein
MKTATVPTTIKRYFWIAGFTAFFLLALLVALNYVVDPYFIHQWDTKLIRRLSPAQQKIMPWVKTYAAYRYRPEVIYLGSSRAEIGLPTDSKVFKGKRVFNLALSGASLGDAVSMLNHTSFFHRPDIVIWGLDYGWQFREEAGNTDFTRTLVAHDSFYPIRRTFLNIKRSVSMAMTMDTMKIILGFSEQSCHSLLASYGQKTSQCLEQIMHNEGGTAKAFEEVLKKRGPEANPSNVAATLQLLDQVTYDHCRNGTTFRFYLHPVHSLAELSYWATRWEDLDNWKRALVHIIDARKQEGCDIRLFDFSGFNSITTEEIPQISGKKDMQNYWEHSHYRSEVGEKILERLMLPDQREEADDFGVELNGATIEWHLLNYHAQRRRYLIDHPWETRNMIP